MHSHGIWFMSFLVYGLLLQALKGQEDSEYSTSSWNRNQHRHRTTHETRLEAFDRVNTRDDSEELEPVKNPRGVVINKAVPGREMHRDVLNSGYVVSDGRRVSRKHTPVKQAQKRTTIEPRQRVFDRIHTTDVHEEFESVTKNQPRYPTKIDPQQDKFDRIVSTDDSEELQQPVTTALPRNPIGIEPQQKVFHRTITTDGSVEFKPVTNIQLQRRTTTEPRLGVFDRMNATDDSDEFEPVTKIQPQTTTKTPLGVLDRVYTTDNSVTSYNGMVINKPEQRQDMHGDFRTQAIRNMTKIDSGRSQKRTSVREQSRVREHEYSTYFDQERKRYKRPGTVAILGHEKKEGSQLTKAIKSRKQGEDKLPMRKHG